jgi:ElaB/YqjD/DUF883 family membrane-anchored ribosome-binding protein
MRKHLISGMISIGLAAAYLTGCGQQESDTTKPAEQSQNPGAGANETVKSAVNTVSNEAAKALESGKATANEVVQKASNELAKAASSVTTQFDTLVQQAKSYISEKKYQEAATILQQISSLKLTPEQQKLYDDLKAQVQKALASQATQDATKAVGNILGGKK